MKKNYKEKDFKNFGLLIGILFPILYGFLIPFLWSHDFKFWTLIVGLLFLILGKYKPVFLKIPYKLWMKFGDILGWINTRIILGVIFLLVLIPISILMKIVGHDPLKKRRLLSKTYLENNQNHVIDLEKIF